MDSEKIIHMSLQIEEVFNNTVTALNDAVTAEQEIYTEKRTDQ